MSGARSAVLDETHDAGIGSWVTSANRDGTDFPLQNLPLGVFQAPGAEPHIGVAIGDSVFDLHIAAELGLLGDASEHLPALKQPTLNAVMARGRPAAEAIRKAAFSLLREGSAQQAKAVSAIFRQSDMKMLLPTAIGDFTDFFTSIDHAARASQILRPGTQAPQPNFRSLPVAYHGRSSSVAVSGTPCTRPWGQRPEGQGPEVIYAPTARLDFELEVGAFVGQGTTLGERVAIDDTESQVFGLCLVNDWSARDIQRWEAQPLGPFLAKSFLTTISPWVVTLEALAPFRIASPRHEQRPLPHLDSDWVSQLGGFDISLQARITTEAMRVRRVGEEVITNPSFRHQYWSLFQMVAHHSSNGCNLRPGDLLASGTVSDPEPDAAGCLLELSLDGREPIALPNGEHRGYLEDGDEVSFTGQCRRDGFRSIGFGRCTGKVAPAMV